MVRHTVAWALPMLCVLALYLTGHAASAPPFTPAPTQVVVQRNANLRAGPGTGYAIVGYAKPGQAFSVLGCNADCTWYQLAPDCWIAAFLVAPTQAAALIAPSSSIDGAALSETVAFSVTNPTRCPQTTGSVSTRAGPGAFFAVVDTRPAGECVAVVGRNEAGDWYQLSHGMWILAAAIRYAEPQRTIPVTESTPTPTSTPIPTNTLESGTQVATPTPSRGVILGGGLSGQGCDPNYAGACVPPYPPDVNCDSLPKNFARVGNDPHGLDRNNNGIACED